MDWEYETVDISELKGKTLTNIEIGEFKDEILFVTDDGSNYRMYHIQDCCEDVSIEDIVGDINDLLNTPILEAEKVNFVDGTPPDVNPPPYSDESCTWTFYKLGTIRGSVTFRWYGSSNGYYSEEVDIVKLPNPLDILS